MQNHVILGVHVTDRVKQAPNVQQVFTEFGDHIRTRVGLHDVHGIKGTPSGMILLEMTDDGSACKLTEKLSSIGGVEVQKMIFKHA